jgi:hypothetical protein
MYFLANDPRIPEEVRTAVAKWGLPKDEFKDNGGWPHQIYVREARRMVGAYVMTELDCLDKRPTPDSVGMGSYTLDSHNVRRYVTPEGNVQNEGDIGVHCPRPYEGRLRRAGAEEGTGREPRGPGRLSSSHIAYGSIRMEPVFMVLGQSAATAAVMAIQDNLAVQDVPYAKLRAKLLEDGQVLEFGGGGVGRVARRREAERHRRRRRAGQDDGDLVAQPRAVALHRRRLRARRQRGEGPKKLRFEIALPKPGKYEARLAYTPNPNRATNVPVTVEHSGGTASVKVNERKAPDVEKVFVLLGTYEFGAKAVVEVSNADTDGFVVVDAIQLVER